MVVVYDIAKVISTAVMGFPNADRVVGEVDIAVITCWRSLSAEALGSIGVTGLTENYQQVSGFLQASHAECTYILASLDVVTGAVEMVNGQGV